MAQRSHTLLGFLCALSLVGLSGCGSMSLTDAGRIDYKSAGEKPVSTLEVPPDLTQLQRDNRYALPQTGTVTASDYAAQRQMQSEVKDASSVALSQVGDMRIERAGQQRWLVVQKTPEELWPLLKEFWQDAGFLINVEMPDVGVMETDWAENRAKIPMDFIRRNLGKLIDSLYSTGERDKFRTRLERTASGETEIYISHRGATEELVGSNNDTTVWTARPSDPELEAEFLSRVMVRLGADKQHSQTMAKQQDQRQAPKADLVNGEYVQVEEGFERTWRRVGLALDRVGFTVEDRNRMQGLYYVRYVDQDADSKGSDAKPGFFSSLFSSKTKDGMKAQQYLISVKQSADSSSRVEVLAKDGQPERSPVGSKILELLHEQLK